MEMRELAELHSQGVIYHLHKEPPAQAMCMHCRGAHFLPLIIQTDTGAVMDMQHGKRLHSRGMTVSQGSAVS